MESRVRQGSSEQPAGNRRDRRIRGKGVASAEAGAGSDRLYAALDLGTNNCRLLIAAPARRGFRIVDAFSRIVRLGEGLGASGSLSDEAVDRTISALSVCADKMKARGVSRRRMIATQACRIASNGEEFLQRVEAETGIQLEIIAPETEAMLAIAGCSTLIDPQASGVLVFDIGGGSTELVWVDLSAGWRGPYRLHRQIDAWTSMPLGVVTLAEQFGGAHVTAETFERIVEHCQALISDFHAAAAIEKAMAGGGVHLLGTSGTVTTIAGVHLGLKRYDRSRVDGTWMVTEEVKNVTERLIDMGYEARAANPCIGRERADLVLTGLAIFEAIRRRWPCERIRVADRGLREGMLSLMMSEDRVWQRRRKRSRRRTRAAGEAGSA